jgi:hypothetical protein
MDRRGQHHGRIGGSEALLGRSWRSHCQDARDPYDAMKVGENPHEICLVFATFLHILNVPAHGLGYPAAGVLLNR